MIGVVLRLTDVPRGNNGLYVFQVFRPASVKLWMSETPSLGSALDKVAEIVKGVKLNIPALRLRHR